MTSPRDARGRRCAPAPQQSAGLELLLVSTIVLVGFVALATLGRDLGVAQWRYLSRWIRLAPLRRHRRDAVIRE